MRKNSRHEDDDDHLDGAAGRFGDDDTWTPAAAGAALIWALRLARVVAGPTGPRGYGNGMPDVVYTAEEVREMVALTDVPRITATSAMISRMEAVLNWQGRYLAVDPALVGDSRVLKVYLRCRANKASFSKECKRRGWGRTRSYEQRDRALSAISQGLVRDQVPLFRV
mgnify:FL=1